MDLELILSDRAQADLSGIRAHTLRRWGEKQLDRYTLFIEKTFHSILRRPDIGRHRTGSPKNLKSLRAGRHMIFYRATDRNIEIVRILHESMDFFRHLG